MNLVKISVPQGFDVAERAKKSKTQVITHLNSDNKMKTYKIHCDDPWFSLIRQGVKPVEGRKKTHTYKFIQAGDTIEFTNGTESFKTLVTEVREYDSLESYFEDVTLEKALPGISTLEEGLNIYYRWSPEEKIRQYGFLGIFVKPI